VLIRLREGVVLFKRRYNVISRRGTYCGSVIYLTELVTASEGSLKQKYS
jgi:hypothetical protein